MPKKSGASVAGAVLGWCRAEEYEICTAPCDSVASVVMWKFGSAGWVVALSVVSFSSVGCSSEGDGGGSLPPTDVPAAGVGGVAGATMVAGTGGAPAGTGVVGGVGGAAGTLAGTGGLAGTSAPVLDAGATADAGVDAGTIGGGTCCPAGDCICRGEVPTSLTSADGPYATTSYSLAGVGCIYHPTDAEPPFSAVAIADGFGGAGGCGAFAQTSGWGPFYASHGIVTMIVETLGGDQPMTRGMKLLGGIAGLKDENDNPMSAIYGQLAGRYGTSGFSMGGGGTTYAASDDPTLLSSVAIMAWTPTGLGVTVPTLFTCGSSDGLAGCATHGGPAYDEMPPETSKMMVTVTSGHNGQPSAGSNMQGAWGLAFQKLFLDGDERWRAVLLSGSYDDTNIQ